MFPLASKIAGPAVSQIYLEGLNHRVGVKATGPQCEGCLPPADVLKKAEEMQIASQEMMAIPELDSWTYSQQYNNGTRTIGASMVCDVLVCRMWKAGGLFAGIEDLNCGEFTNLDAYDLNILDPKPQGKPAQCAANDPENPHCQTEGTRYLTTCGNPKPTHNA